MPIENPQLGRGATLGFSIGLATIATILNVKSVDGPSLSVGEVETTTLASTFKPYLPTLPEGEVTFNINYIGMDPSVQALKSMLAVAPVPLANWLLTYEDAGTDAWKGFVKSFAVTGIENETVVSAAVSIRMTTALTSTYPLV